MRRTLLLLALAIPAAAQELHAERFQRGTVTVRGRIQDFIPYDLDRDGRSDFLITHVAFPHEAGKAPWRYISVKWNRGGAPDGRPDQTWVAPAEAAALMFGDYSEAPGIEVGYLCATGAFVWEIRDGRYGPEAKRLILAETFFDLAQVDSLPFWWWPVDLDANGLTDLLLPQSDSYRLYMQTEPGVYGRAFPLAVGTSSRADESGAADVRVVKSLARVETRDVDGDFRDDVCVVAKDEFVYWLQGTKKEGEARAPSFPSEPSGRFQLRFLRQKEKKDQIATAITYLCELNRGGGVDFVASYTAGSLANIDKVTTDYYMYLGNGGQPIDNLAPNWRISLPGISVNPQIEDLDADGHPDIAVSSFETSTVSNAGKVVFQKVPVEHYIYLFDREKQRFSPEYDYKETLYVDLDRISAGGGTPRLVFRGDFDGDGRKDVLRLDSEGWLSAARGIASKTLLKDRPVDFDRTDLFKVQINDVDEAGKPDAPRDVAVWELNGDGKSDLVLRWSSRVKIMLSR
jgi:hypothetical protein